jgi:hypothetical protein
LLTEFFMPKQITTYACDDCGKQHVFENNAVACEERHRKERERKCLPAAHDRDDLYHKHCVNCGEQVIVYERCWDGIDKPTVGRATFSTRFEMLFGGRWCEKCHGLAKGLILQCLYEAKKGGQL